MIHKSYYFSDVKSIVKLSVSLSRRSENLISTGVVKSLSLYVILTSRLSPGATSCLVLSSSVSYESSLTKIVVYSSSVGRLSSQVQHFLERTSIGEKKSRVLRGRLLIKATTVWSSSSVTL